MNRVLAIIMAGGVGERLQPLTKGRSKAAVPFGGKFRLIDFTLSNCINSGLRQIYVLTQYLSEPLNRYIQNGWGISIASLGDFIYCIPAQQKLGVDWYRGTADAVRQNLNLVRTKDVEDVLVLSGDHIYKMNYSQFVAYHRMKKAGLTISAIRARKEQAENFLGKVPEEYAFWCYDGSIFRDMKELAEGLVAMSDEVFAYHANPEKNDFSNWVRDVIKDEKLVDDLAQATSKVQAAGCVAKRVTYLIVQVT
jgi:glucose-1-phosphate adenylyltransferase